MEQNLFFETTKCKFYLEPKLLDGQLSVAICGYAKSNNQLIHSTPLFELTSKTDTISVEKNAMFIEAQLNQIKMVYQDWTDEPPAEPEITEKRMDSITQAFSYLKLIEQSKTDGFKFPDVLP